MGNPILAADITPKRVEWLWRERVPRGMITIIAGRPDQGKGLACANIASDVSNSKVIDKTTGKLRYGQVLYSAIEDSAELMTRPRLEAAGANLSNIWTWRFQIPAQLTELAQYIVQHKIDLIVIDPFAAHLSHGVNRQSDNIRTVLNPLSAILEETGAAVVVVEHVLKRVPQNGHPLQAIGGSGSGVVAAARMAFLFGIDPSDEDKRVLVPVKHNICEKPKAVCFEIDATDIPEVGDVPFLLYDDECEFDASRLTIVSRHGVMGRPDNKRAAAAEWLTNYLAAAGKPVQAGKVMEDSKQYNMNTKTLRRAAAEMGVLRNPPGGGRNCTWELPQEILDMLDPSDNVVTKLEEAPDKPLAGEPTIEVTDEDIAELLGKIAPTDIEAEKEEEDGDE